MNHRNLFLTAASFLVGACAFSQWSGQQTGGRAFSVVPISAAYGEALEPVRGPRNSRWASESFNVFAKGSGSVNIDDSQLVTARGRAREDSLARVRERWAHQQARTRDAGEGANIASARSIPR